MMNMRPVSGTSRDAIAEVCRSLGEHGRMLALASTHERYRLLGRVGAGGMGSVLEAEDTTTGDRVAIKIVHAGTIFGERGAKIRERFRREASAAASIRTPHVVRVLDVGTMGADERPFIAMELLRGGDLAALLKESGRLEPELAIKIAGQALRGLSAAHDAGVLHRDLDQHIEHTEVLVGGEALVGLRPLGQARARRRRLAVRSGARNCVDDAIELQVHVRTEIFFNSGTVHLHRHPAARRLARGHHGDRQVTSFAVLLDPGTQLAHRGQRGCHRPGPQRRRPDRLERGRQFARRQPMGMTGGCPL